MPESTFIANAEVTHLKYLWNDAEAERLKNDPIGLLRYRSNLLGADLRITNFGGGNTSSKIELPDPFTGKPARVLAVKGSGGDLGSIQDSGFALLYMNRLEELKALYRGEEHEDEMVGYYPLSAFGQNKVAASIDTPLHAFVPYAHVDHLHPDWAIAIAASANGKLKLEEFNKRYGRHLVWLHWQRPGFELGLQLEQAIAANPGCNGVLLGSHGLFTWGNSQRECYLNSIQTIDQMGEFVLEHQKRLGEGALFGGMVSKPLEKREKLAAAILPTLRGVVSSNRRNIAHFDDSEDALRFAGSAWGRQLGSLGTSCPDHFLRTRISPMFIDWKPAEEDFGRLKALIAQHATAYREDYAEYYNSCATADSPKLRDSNPSVVIIPGLGLFGFGKNKKEARITTEFFVNAIHVMAGANALDEGGTDTKVYPQSRHAARSHEFESFRNYVALPRTEAFRIEYWALEEAKLQRMPAEAEFSRKIFLIVGGGSGIGREVALLLAKKGAHLMVADMNAAAVEEAALEAGKLSSPDQVSHCAVDLGSSGSIAEALEKTVLQFGGLDGVINTAAIFPVPGSDGLLSEAQWAKTFHINVTGNFLLAKEAERVLREQNLPAVVVLTSSANAVVPKRGSEAYDVSKTALNHLVRELAVGLGPLVRVNGIAPATVVAGSTMFPRDRVMVSLSKYGIGYSEEETTEELRNKLAEFYAQRTVTRKPILPRDCAAAIVWLAGEESAKTTGHIIPVDGGLSEGFLR